MDAELIHRLEDVYLRAATPNDQRAIMDAIAALSATPQAAQVPEGDAELRIAADCLFFAAINVELMAEFRERFPRKHARLREAIDGIRPLLAAAQAKEPNT